MVDTKPWNINSDEPRAYEYNEDFDHPSNLPLWYAPTPYRSSDHDPVVVGLSLDSGGLQITRFLLVNTQSGTIVGELFDGDVIDLAQYPNINIIVETDPMPVGSVVFAVDGNVERVENVAPYAIGGDSSGYYLNWYVSPGSYLIEATAYTGSNGQGDAGTTSGINITIIDTTPQLSVTRFLLVDATTDAVIGELFDGDTINLADYGGINIVAETSPTTVGSVVFWLNNYWWITAENVAPYAIAGDNNGDFNSWNIATGTYLLTATPHLGPWGSGGAGDSLTIEITIIDEVTELVPVPSLVALRPELPIV